MPDKSKVTNGKPSIAGAAFNAPLSVAVPTDATTKLDDGWNELGYISEDGLTNSFQRTKATIKAWGGVTVMTYQESTDDSFKCKFIESLNEKVLAVIYNQNRVTGTLATGIKVEVSGDESENSRWVFDQVLRDGNLKRIVIEEAAIASIDDITYKGNDVTGFGVTLQCVANADNVYHVEYIIAKKA